MKKIEQNAVTSLEDLSYLKEDALTLVFGGEVQEVEEDEVNPDPDT